MRAHIISKISKIFNDFQNDLNNIGRFCELKDLRFDSNHTPDYSNPVIQRLYLLRYFPAYLVEYYLMYKAMFRKDFLGKNLNIISIGAGCGIDFWAGKFASEEFEKKISIRYTGMDIIEWNYWDDLGIRNCYFLQRNINQMDILDEDGYNVIVFPKSIGELNNSTFASLKQIIQNTNFTCDRIMVLSSVRTTRDFIDVNRLAEIVTIFKTVHGYSCLDSKHQYTYYLTNPDGKYDRLEEICHHFTYPSEIRDYITSLNNKCAGYQENWYEPHSPDCSLMDRWPILTTSQIKYQVLRLER